MKFEGLGTNRTEETDEYMRLADDGNPNAGDYVEGTATADTQPQSAEVDARRVDTVSDPGSIDTFEHEGGLVPEKE